MDTKHCSGCRNNYYNGQGADKCWMLDTAKVITQYEIGMDSPMNVKANYRKVRKPGCYVTGGYSGTGTGTALVAKIPHYAE